MKKFVIWTCIIAAICLVAGVLLIGFGRSLGAGGWSYNIKTGEYRTSDKLYEGSEKVDAFDSLDIDVPSADIVLKKGDGYMVEYRLEAEPVIENKGNTLSIRIKDDSVLTLSLGTTVADYIYITVPSDDTVYESAIEFSSGSFTSDDINLQGKIEYSSGKAAVSGVKKSNRLFFDLSSGKADLKDSKIDDVDIKIVSGDVSIKNCEMDNLSYDASSGDLDITDVRARKFNSKASSGKSNIVKLSSDEITMEKSSGKTDIEINGKEEDYSVDVDVSSGDVRVGSVESNGDVHIEKNTEKFIKMNSSSGDVNISFAE